MKITKDHVDLAVKIGIAVILSLILFGKSSRYDKTAYNDAIKAKESEVQAIRSERDVYRAWKDSTIAELRRNDEVLQSREKTIITKYEKIPVYINALDREQLRDEIRKLPN
jgi:hypothetical protein